MNSKELDICFSLKEITALEEIKIVYVGIRVSRTGGKTSNTFARRAALARAEQSNSNFVMETVETVLERFRFANLKAVSYSVIKNRFGPTSDNISHQLARMILRRRDELLYAEKRSQLTQYEYNGFFYRKRS